MDISQITTVSTTVKKTITLDEGKLEELLIEEACAKFNCQPKDVSVEFEVRHDIIQEVRIIFESTLVEEPK